MPMKSRLLSRLVVTLAVGEVVLVLLSWFLSATQWAPVRTLLSSEGVRWFFSGFTSWLASPPLAWLLLLSMAWGPLRRSGLLSRRPVRRRRLALRVALLLLLFYVGVILLLTVLPHALLLSALGSLWQSPFSHAFIAIVALGVILCAAAYGFVVRSFLTLADLFQAMVDGLCVAAPLVLVYVLLIQFYESLCYIFF